MSNTAFFGWPTSAALHVCHFAGFSRAQFPLPRPSLGGRGRIIARARRHPVIAVARARRQPAIAGSSHAENHLPLPEGEGRAFAAPKWFRPRRWGEGEENAQLFTRCPLMMHLPTALLLLLLLAGCSTPEKSPAPVQTKPPEAAAPPPP